MNCYLMRHGDAVAAAENPQRPLSLRGRQRVDNVARLALERGMQISRICHSGILRAQETAAIMAEHFAPAGGIAALSGLKPDDDPLIVKAELESAAEPMLLVSHLPLMSRVASALVHGDPERPAVEFLPADLVCVTHLPERWEILWRITA